MKTYLVAINGAPYVEETSILDYLEFSGGIAVNQYGEPETDEEMTLALERENEIPEYELAGIGGLGDEAVALFIDEGAGNEYIEELVKIINKYTGDIKSILESHKLSYDEVDPADYVECPSYDMEGFTYECDDQMAEEIKGQLDSLRNSYLQEVEDLGSASCVEETYNLKLGECKVDLDKIELIYGIEIE